MGQWTAQSPLPDTVLSVLDLQTNRGETALFIASMRGHLDVVTFLITAGAQIDIANVDGETALSASVKFGNIREVTMQLFYAGCPYRVCTRTGDEYAADESAWRLLDMLEGEVIVVEP